MKFFHSGNVIICVGIESYSFVEKENVMEK